MNFLANTIFVYSSVYLRRKWQPTPLFLPGESQGWGILVGCHLWGLIESDMTEETQQQQQCISVNSQFPIHPSLSPDSKALESLMFPLQGTSAYQLSPTPIHLVVLLCICKASANLLFPSRTYPIHFSLTLPAGAVSLFCGPNQCLISFLPLLTILCKLLSGLGPNHIRFQPHYLSQWLKIVGT